MVMWSHVSEFLRFADDDVVSLGAEERAGGQLDLQAQPIISIEFRLEEWIAGVDLSRPRSRDRETRSLAPFAEHRTHLIYRILKGNNACAWSCGRLSLPASRSAGERRIACAVQLSAIEDRYEISAAHTQPSSAAHATVRSIDAQIHHLAVTTFIRSFIASSKVVVMSMKEIFGVRDFFKSICRNRSGRHDRWSTEPWEIVDV